MPGAPSPKGRWGSVKLCFHCEEQNQLSCPVGWLPGHVLDVLPLATCT